MRLVALILASIVGLFITATILLDLFPPKTVRMAAGAQGSAYHAIAVQYRDLLAEDGITLEIIESAGSVENMALLDAGDADAAIVQGGIPAAGAQVGALGTVFLEPLLVFHPENLRQADDPARWADLRVAGGGAGSGTRYAIETTFAALNLPLPETTLLPLGGADAVAALLSGEVDAAVFVAPVFAPYLQPLYDDEGIALASIRDVEALRRRLPFVMEADLPPAGINYAAVKPAERIDLVAMAAQLMARNDLHPALVDRFVKAARTIHGDQDLISSEGQFPSVEATTVAMNKQAATLLASPQSRLDRYMPFWIVAQINKVALLLLPLILVLLPLLRFLPGIYAWTMRSRVYRRYSELLAVEKEAITTTDPARLAELGLELDKLQHELTETRLPESFRDQSYTMQMHIDLVRSRIENRTPRA